MEEVSAKNDETDSIIDDIAFALKKRMEKFITEKSARSRAKSWSKPHKQSHKSLAFDTIFNNLLVGQQQLPARPRDFRLNMAEQESKIDYGELSDELARLVRLYILGRHEDKLPRPRGRPNSELSSETRGRLSYYEPSSLKKQISNALSEPSTVRHLNERLIKDKILYRFVKYSIASAFYQARENEDAFLNSFRPYGLRLEQLEMNSEKGWKLAEFNKMSDERLESLAGAYSKNVIRGT